MIRLVGRDRELVVLDEALARMNAGEREVVVITGEPGIGKSRLLDELAARVARHGGRAVWGRTMEVGLTPAFWPWRQLLVALEEGDDRAPRLDTLDGRADAGARLALFDAVVGFLVRCAERGPIALLVDDAHAADPSSLQLLEHVIPLLARRRVLLALAARDGDAPADISAVLGRLLRGARRVSLGPLRRDDVAALVGERTDPARVFELSDGNPLFVEELLASLDARGALELPRLSSVREVVRERVARLPEPARAVLAAASVVGRDFRGAVVADMLDGIDVPLALAPALRLGMVAMTTSDRFRFSHALVVEAIADELDIAQRARFHLRAAQSLERREPDAASAIAHHLLAAGSLAAEAAVAAAERAARAAAAQLAFEDAASLLERALGALALAAPEDVRRRIELAIARSEVLQHAGQHARATALLDELEPVTRELGDVELIARRALARGLRWTFGKTDPLLIAALEDALGRLGDAATPLRARVLARLAAAMQPAVDSRVPIARAREAIGMARSFPPRARLEIMYTATAALVDYVGPDELEALHHEVLDLARAEGDRLIAVHTQLRLCFTALERVDRPGFERAAATHAALVEQLGLPRRQLHVHQLAGLRAALDGDTAAAAAAAARARQLATELDDQHAVAMCTLHEGFVAFTQTRPPDERLAQLARGFGAEPEIVLAWLAADAGDLAEARAQLAAMRPINDVMMEACAATAAALVGDRARAEHSYTLIAPRSGTIVLASAVGCCVLDLNDRVLLLLATTLERWEAIDGHAESALAVAAKLASPVWAARVRGDWADALARRGGAGDAERARELWTNVVAEAERLAMPRLLERARAALAGEPPRVEPVPAPPAKRDGAVRVQKTGELWTVSGFGDEIHVRDSRGMQMLAQLVAEPGRELHALDLAGGGDAVDGGDAGEVLDPKARAQYKQRLAELVAERDQAEGWGDAGRAERASAEIEALTAELERAVGLGGRERRAGGAAERARSNVQRRILHAIQQIRAGSQRLGEHFAATVRTGTYCCYAP